MQTRLRSAVPAVALIGLLAGCGANAGSQHGAAGKAAGGSVGSGAAYLNGSASAAATPSAQKPAAAASKASGAGASARHHGPKAAAKKPVAKQLSPAQVKRLHLPKGTKVTKTKLTPAQRAVLLRVRRDERRVAKTLIKYIQLIDAHDPSVCTDYLDASFLHASTGKTGSAAVASCQSTISRTRLSVKLARVEGIRIAGRYALIQFVTTMGNLGAREIFRMVYANGHYRIDGVEFTRKAKKGAH
jgi:hypothetical protein